jgi:hypothetical protein
MKNPRSRPRAIDKNLAQQARVLDKLSDEGFEEAVTEARANVAHRRARKRTESEREATIRGQPPNQLENERKTTLVRMQQAEIEVAGAKAKSEMHKLWQGPPHRNRRCAF